MWWAGVRAYRSHSSVNNRAKVLLRSWCHGVASQRSLHNAPIFRLLLKVAVNGTHQCDFLNFCGGFGSQHRPISYSTAGVNVRAMCPCICRSMPSCAQPDSSRVCGLTVSSGRCSTSMYPAGQEGLHGNVNIASNSDKQIRDQ